MNELTIARVKARIMEEIRTYQQGQEKALDEIGVAENSWEVFNASARLNTYEQIENALVQLHEWIGQEETLARDKQDNQRRQKAFENAINAFKGD